MNIGYDADDLLPDMPPQLMATLIHRLRDYGTVNYAPRYQHWFEHGIVFAQWIGAEIFECDETTLKTYYVTGPGDTTGEATWESIILVHVDDAHRDYINVPASSADSLLAFIEANDSVDGWMQAEEYNEFQIACVLWWVWRYYIDALVDTILRAFFLGARRLMEIP